MKNFLTIISLFLFASTSALAQTFGLKMQEVSNDGSNYIISIQIQMMGDNPEDFQLGSSSLQFTFPNNALSNPVLESTTLVIPFPYFEPTVTVPLIDQCSFNVELSTIDGGTTIATAPAWTELGQINFTIDNAAQLVPLTWSYNGGTTQTVVYLDDEATQIFAHVPVEDNLIFEPLEPSTDPIFTFIPGDITLECGELIPLEMATAITENSECEDVVVTYTDNVINEDCGSTIERVFTATDACNNSNSVTQLITIVDTADPIFTAPPSNLVLQCMDDVPPFEFLAVEDCSQVITTDSTENIIGSCPTTITRSWTATDACGNSVTHVQTISVEDTTPPIFDTFPVDQQLPWDTDPIPAVEDPTYSDNCDDDLTVTFEEETEQFTNGGSTITRTWTLTDDCGNETIMTQTLDLTFGASIQSMDDISFSISLFPNPVIEHVSLNIELTQASQLNISTYNILGEIITNSEENLLGGLTKINLDFSDFDAGVYFIKVNNGIHSQMLPVVKK